MGRVCFRWVAVTSKYLLKTDFVSSSNIFNSTDIPNPSLTYLLSPKELAMVAASAICVTDVM